MTVAISQRRNCRALNSLFNCTMAISNIAPSGAAKSTLPLSHVGLSFRNNLTWTEMKNGISYTSFNLFLLTGTSVRLLDNSKYLLCSACACFSLEYVGYNKVRPNYITSVQVTWNFTVKLTHMWLRHKMSNRNSPSIK